jgi:ABC-type anion transport system duplicated permease subunit
MDNIDITSSEFTINDISNDIIGGGDDLSVDSLYIYIGVLVFALLAIVFLYKMYNRHRRVTFQDKLDDCYGDVCRP